MGLISWQANPAGAYWIDVIVGHLALNVMVDTGLTDPRRQLGFALEPPIYNQLKQAGQLVRFCTRVSRDASGQYATAETAETAAQLLDARAGQPAGPIVRVFVCRGASGVPSRVGVAFFHHLSGCRVQWNLDAQTWTIEYV